MRKRPTVRTRWGFTLIELLVVIAIIAILAAILFPVFAQARDKARSASCLSNTKQMAVAFAMYTTDYDELMVPDYYGDWSPCCAARGGHWPWMKLLIPYVKNKGVYTCPSHPRANWDALAGAYGAGFEYEFPSVIGYGYNNIGLSRKALAEIERPADTYAIMESRYYPPGHASYNGSWGWYTVYPPSISPALIDYARWLTADRHNQGNNVVFADGHAKWARWDYITSNQALKNYNVPSSYQ